MTGAVVTILIFLAIFGQENPLYRDGPFRGMYS